MMRDADIISNLRFLCEKADRAEKGLIVIEPEKAKYIFGEAIAALERATNAEKTANEKILKLVDLLVKE